MRCLQCQTDLPENAKFCTNCGAKVIKCQVCGYDKISLEIKFCPNCGNKIISENTDQVSANNVNFNELPTLIKIIEEIKKNILEAVEFSFNNLEIYRLLQCIRKDNSILTIRDELKNKEKLKINFDIFLEKVINLRRNLYNNLLQILSIENRLIFKDEISIEYKVNSIIKFKKNEIYNFIDLLYIQLENVINIIKENNPELGDYLKRGLLIGGIYLGHALFPVAAHFAQMIFSGDESNTSGQKEDIDNNFYNLISTKNRISLELDEIFNIILEDIKNNLEDNFKKILNKYIIDTNTDYDLSRLEDNLKIFLSKLKLKISGFNTIKEDILEFNKSLNKSILDGQLKLISDNLPSEEDKIKLSNIINTRNDSLFKELEQWEWWSFIGNYPTSPYLKNNGNANFQDIIKRFQINSNFESFFLLCNSSLFCKDSNKNFNEKKIANFVKNFRNLESNKIKLYFDLTLFGGGDE